VHRCQVIGHHDRIGPHAHLSACGR
jgi:hypothetical protein